MPHALRVFKSLRDIGFNHTQALAIASVVETAKASPCKYRREQILDDLCEEGVEEVIAESLCDALRNCFASERFALHFDQVTLKTGLVRARLQPRQAEVFLAAVAPSVVTPRKAEIRKPVTHEPSPGRVVMCDFTFLTKPEMQKERRAIVVSSRAEVNRGRCSVVPVSMSPSRDPNPHYHEFRPGSYPFFHSLNPVWAVCDHVYTVSLGRLWWINVNHRPALTHLTAADLQAVRTLLGTALGLPR